MPRPRTPETRAREKAYYEAHREEILARRRARWEANPAYARWKNNQYYAKNAQTINENARKRRTPEQIEAKRIRDRELRANMSPEKRAARRERQRIAYWTKQGYTEAPPKRTPQAVRPARPSRATSTPTRSVKPATARPARPNKPPKAVRGKLVRFPLPLAPVWEPTPIINVIEPPKRVTTYLCRLGHPFPSAAKAALCDKKHKEESEKPRYEQQPPVFGLAAAGGTDRI